MPAIPWLATVPLDRPSPVETFSEPASDDPEALAGWAVIDRDALPGLANWLEWRSEPWVTPSN